MSGTSKIEYQVTCTAPVNIAVIKYWGKRNSKLMLPTNSSLSCTLSQDYLQTRTTIKLSSTFDVDRIFLNGKEEDIQNPRLQSCLNETRKLRKELESRYETESKPYEKLSEVKVLVASINNFPTAAGLASSASGYACLVYTLCKLYQLDISVSDMSKIARLGSGSACRSLFGGFVAWEMGVLPDGSDSKAIQIAPESHWDDIEALICVVSDKKKTTSSTLGMQNTVQTSPLLQHRIKEVVPKRMEEMIEAIKNKDFTTFAKLTMVDSNQFHAVCLDTYPPISYMNDVSRAIVQLITILNSSEQGIVAAYTFDAGPNAVIYAPKAMIPKLVQLISYFFPAGEDTKKYFNDPLNIFNGKDFTQVDKDDSTFIEIQSKLNVFPQGAVNRIIHTPLGDGPRVLEDSEALILPDGQIKTNF